ncbi:hypothetical protein HDV05_006096 [Chytridiales sp. JEL 0842]|nr:hypothetical protein HDV05_006096 [Chytridiales sp. JEL 0842]
MSSLLTSYITSYLSRYFSAHLTQYLPFLLIPSSWFIYYRILKQIYDYVMALPGTPAVQWKPPSSVILKPAAKAALFFAPVSDHWVSLAEGTDAVLEDPNSKVMFVANSGFWSLEATSLVAAIYMKTGRVPRRLTDPFHFKIPVWKHLIEYLGAIPGGDNHVLEQVMAKGHPVLVHPGGRQESLRKKADAVNSLQWPAERTDFVELAIQNGYTLIPLATVGTESMFTPLLDVSIEPLLWLLGDTRADVKTVPILLPKSYQKQYMCVSNSIRTQGLTKVEAAQVKERCKNSVERCMEMCVEAQSRDATRFLLEPLWKMMGGEAEGAHEEGEGEARAQANGSASREVPVNGAGNGAASPDVGIRKRISSVLKSFAHQLDPDQGRPVEVK